ncbi:hypothetical protein LTR85_005915 [Meristemomyces frigidus]|nr:hypothetical protein LTR85_005915 [Meristemomyces frigidus]
MAKRKAAGGSASVLTCRKTSKTKHDQTPGPQQWPDQRCHLLELPVKLLKDILEEYLDYRGGTLLQLRATCKTLEALTEPLVGSCHFRYCSFMLADRDSMEALRGITERPAFAQSLYRIYLTNGTADKWSASSGTMVTRGQLRAARLEQEEVGRAESEFRAGEDIDCLVAIFKNFMLAGKAPAIVCTGDTLRPSPNSRPPYGFPVGYKTLQKQLGYDRCLNNFAEDSIAYAASQDAMVESGFPVETLEIGGPHASVPLTLFGYEGVPDAFKHLKTLRLELAPERYYGDDVDGDKSRGRDLRGFISVLESAQSLADLTLKTADDPYVHGSHSATFSAMAAARSKGLILPKLRGLSLDSHSISLPILLDFVASVRSTLQGIHLWRVRDGAAKHPDLNQRIYDALSVPDPPHRLTWRHIPTVSTDPLFASDPHFQITERQYCHEREVTFYLSLFDCYRGSQWTEWDRIYSYRALMGSSIGPKWPRPWPAIEL